MSYQTEQLVGEVHDLVSARDWTGVIETLEPFAVLEPGNHWFLSMTGMGYYYKQDFERAFKYIDASLQLNFECQIGLWLMGNLLRDRGEKQRANAMWEAIACVDSDDKKFEPTCSCCEWETAGRTLIADSKLMLAVTYDELGYKELAKRYRNGYLKAMSEGVKSLVDKEKVREWLLRGHEG